MQFYNISDKYYSDTGKNEKDDVAHGKEIRVSGNLIWSEVIKMAVNLKSPLIIRTHYMSASRPGSWYIKGVTPTHGWKKKTPPNPNTIEKKLKEHMKLRKFRKASAWVIRYTPR